MSEADLPPRLKLANVPPGAPGHHFGLRRGDVLVAVDGQVFSGGANELNQIFQQNRAIPHALTFQRDTKGFTILSGTPALGRWTTSADEALPGFAPSDTDPTALRNWQILRDPRHRYDLIRTDRPLLALAAAPVWLLVMRLWLVCAGLAIVTGFAALLGPGLALAVYGGLSLWIWRNAPSLLRQDRRNRGFLPWMVIAEPTEASAHAKTVELDPRLSALFSAPAITAPQPVPAE